MSGRNRWIAILFLLWNLIGAFAFVSQAMVDPAALTRTDPYMAHQFATMPLWAWAIYAVAILGSVAASTALAMGRAIAIPLYWLSLAALVAQVARGFLITDLLAVEGPGAAGIPALVALIAIGEIAFATRLRRMGLLS